MVLRRRIVNFALLNLLNNPDQAGGVREVAMMQCEIKPLLVRVMVDMIDTICINRRSPTFDAADRISLGQQQLGEIGTVLAGEPVINAVFFDIRGNSLEGQAALLFRPRELRPGARPPSF